MSARHDLCARQLVLLTCRHCCYWAETVATPETSAAQRSQPQLAAVAGVAATAVVREAGATHLQPYGIPKYPLMTLFPVHHWCLDSSQQFCHLPPRAHNAHHREQGQSGGAV